MNKPPENKRHQKKILNELLKTCPKSNFWENWLTKTGELPPDFENMPFCRELPHPLIFNSQKITTMDAWEQKKLWLNNQFTHWIYGKTPDAPLQWSVENLQSQPIQGGVHKQFRLYLDSAHAGSLGFEVFCPLDNNPRPVFMTQTNHRSWALIAFRRGYMSVLYNACDLVDDSESFTKVYPEADWSLIARRAWAASRVIDVLQTMPEADHTKIFLAGHSRNGKQVMAASAFDERIFGVISASSGAMGVCPARLFSEEYFGEGIELITNRFPTWFHPRLRFFVGREEYLPVDMHDLITLIAPRPCLISTAINDNVESVWAIQQAYLAAQTVYQLYQKPEQLQILWRNGGHWMLSETIEVYLDWCDQVLNGELPEQSFDFLLPMDTNEVKNQFPGFQKNLVSIETTLGQEQSLDELKNNQTQTKQKIRTLLGDPPPFAENTGEDYGIEDKYISQLLGRTEPVFNVQVNQRVFGELITANIYSPVDHLEENKRLPLILWLPPISISNGYHAGYFHFEQFYVRLAQTGFKVVTFDPIGMGSRFPEAKDFYQRYPDWSLLGKMLHDASAAITFIKSTAKNKNRQIFLSGFGFGALLGLHLTAIDRRVDGAALACLPQFLNPPNQSSNFWRQISQYTPLLKKDEFPPYQIQDLITCCAPRPLYLVQPTWDKNNAGEAQYLTESGSAVYRQFESVQNFTLDSPLDYMHLSPKIQTGMISWLKQAAKNNFIQQFNADPAVEGN